MLEVLIHAFFGGGTSGFWGGQVVLVIHLSVGQVDFFTKFEPCSMLMHTAKSCLMIADIKLVFSATPVTLFIS